MVARKIVLSFNDDGIATLPNGRRVYREKIGDEYVYRWTGTDIPIDKWTPMSYKYRHDLGLVDKIIVDTVDVLEDILNILLNVPTEDLARRFLKKKLTLELEGISSELRTVALEYEQRHIRNDNTEDKGRSVIYLPTGEHG